MQLCLRVPQTCRTRNAPSPFPRAPKNAPISKRHLLGTAPRAHLGEEHVKRLSGFAGAPYQVCPLPSPLRKAARMPEKTIRTKNVTGRKIAFGNAFKSCNALHDRKDNSELFVFHVMYFG